MPEPTPEQVRTFIADCRLRRLAARKDTPMIQTTALPLDPARLADLLLAPAADANSLYQQLAAQIGVRLARQVLAAAHSIAAERLWAETA